MPSSNEPVSTDKPPSAYEAIWLREAIASVLRRTQEPIGTADRVGKVSEFYRALKEGRQ